MSGCFEFASSMTGSTNSGPLQPQKDSSPLPASPFDFYSTPKNTAFHNHRQRPPRKMTLSSPNGQPIQLTPLWEHVVRTRKFPSEVDTRLTFLEISERLRDPEWEVRQHALRVLIDVLPTLNADIMDKVMQPVVPELVNNLGHPAPAVRKGALDALRVFLIHSRDRENTIKRILQDGLNRSEVCDSFQTNVTTGVILSVPSLLFPSSSSPSPSPQLVKDATIALGSRLAQVPHQEAVLKSLTKIRDAVGTETFESYLEDYDDKLKKNIEILSKIYNIKSGKKTQKKSSDSKSIEKVAESKDNRKWDTSDSDTSGIAEEEDEVNTAAMSAARVVLETEIKFNEETAITMTILEEKEDSEKEQDEESGTDVRNDAEGKDASPDRRKTPRRVHFGGEVVKLRTPDSDETGSIEATPKTRIPVPVSPATKMPNARPRPSSQPCSPRREPGKARRTSRSVSNSPKREVHMHNADLSPKKSILTRTGSPLLKKKRKSKQNSESSSTVATVTVKAEEDKKENVVLIQNGQSDSTNLNDKGLTKTENVEETSDNKNITDEAEEAKDGSEGKVPEDASQKVDSLFGSPIKYNETEQHLDEVKENEGGCKLRSCTTSVSKHDNVDCERTARADRDKAAASVIEKNGSAAVDEAEVKSEEPSWEELGLVDQEVLNDLHNKEDWRARVRGLERVASALRTSSALIAIEPRLGSLLHAVLGCERSCRVAAAALAVAKVVVAGVSEEALKRQLPQLAWGLARHGGPSATQLARITMLRLRPALLLEQLLQPQCLNARNAKTRENTLQLLIFSLVTFPSTEFKVDTVANKVAKMVRDRRRRVRQAALDTLAVLAQIYESEEVLAAGKRASEGYHDAEAMMSAIRARLARKSLPLVSADGLVMYGLQISPAVQIATGPDVDWIVAGSGSVSPSVGRTKSQIIATRSEKERLSRNENDGYESPWIERPNFVALGIGMRSKHQPIVWQMVPTQNQDIQCEDEVNLLQATRGAATDIRNGEGFNLDIKSRNQTRIPGFARESANYRNIIEDRRGNGGKAESRIPVLYVRDRNQDKSGNFELTNANSKRRFRDNLENGAQEENFRNSGAMYYRRRKNQQENNSNYDNYRSMKSNMSSEYSIANNSSQESSNDNSTMYPKYVEKNKSLRKPEVRSKCNCSSSRESHQCPLSKNAHQQSFIMQNVYNTDSHRENRFADENSFRPLQTTPYNTMDFNQRIDENNDNNLSRVSNRPVTFKQSTKFYRRTKDVAAQKITDVQMSSTDVQTGEYFPAIDTSARRKFRSLSPSQLHHRQQFVKVYDIDKTVNEEEYNEKNKHYCLSEGEYRVPRTNIVDAQFEEDDYEQLSSDLLKNNCHEDIEQDVLDTQDDTDNRSSSSDRPDVDSAFDIITGQPTPPSRDTIDFVISLDQKAEIPVEATNTLNEDELLKVWSSDEEVTLKNENRASSRQSEFHEVNQNDSEDVTSDGSDGTSLRRSIASVSSNERVLKNENLQTSRESLHSDLQDVVPSPLRRSVTPKKSSRSSSRNSNDFEALKSPRRSSRSSSRKLSFDLEDKDAADLNEKGAKCEKDSFQTVESNQSRRGSKKEDSPTIVIASRPHSSTENLNYSENQAEISVQVENNNNALRFVDKSKENNNLEDRQSRDSSSETNTEPGILKIETQPVEPINLSKRITSKAPRVTGRYRGVSSKRNSEKVEKTKPIVQQCFVQLESKDWEITMKGLKTLSQLAKQQPEYLDVFATATICRLLGRQIRSLRSQVARTACLAAGDIFSSQIRGIDQDFEDIAESLLHRTADTNRFLRADCNAALDRMIEHLPPHRTIGVIVQRGASHQNAIVRAATARLLASIVDRIGPEHTMILPKDVKDKLLSTGAKLLMDGNLDARNHAKKMFRHLVHCEGFRKALTDAVPETTLRHIDKTLKTL